MADEVERTEHYHDNGELEDENDPLTQLLREQEEEERLECMERGEDLTAAVQSESERKEKKRTQN